MQEKYIKAKTQNLHLLIHKIVAHNNIQKAFLKALGNIKQTRTCTQKMNLVRKYG